MELIKKANKLAVELEEQDLMNSISPIIRQLVIELEIRRHLELKVDGSDDNPTLIRVNKK